VAARFGRHGMPPPASDPDFWPFDLETGTRVTSMVGNLPSKFGHARPLGSRIIHYVCDRRTGKSTAYCPLPTVGSITNYNNRNRSTMTRILQLKRWVLKVCVEKDWLWRLFVWFQRSTGFQIRTLFSSSVRSKVSSASCRGNFVSRKFCEFLPFFSIFIM